MDFKLQAIVLLSIIALVALGPLLFFVPRLASLRRQGILEYGILGQIQSTEFHEKWCLHRGVPSPSVVSVAREILESLPDVAEVLSLSPR